MRNSIDTRKGTRRLRHDTEMDRCVEKTIDDAVLSLRTGSPLTFVSIDRGSALGNTYDRKDREVAI